MKNSISIFAAAILMLLLPLTASAAARDTIKIVGSSTVYPFATVVACLLYTSPSPRDDR